MRVSKIIWAVGLAALVGAACTEDKSDTTTSGGVDPAVGAEPGAEPSGGVGETEGGSALAAVAPKGLDIAGLVEKIGVEPGAWEQPKDVGAEAVVATREGSVGVRRVGEEAFADVTADKLQLFAGDQLRTGAEGKATVTMADETVVELAADSVVAVGDRNAGADPASSAAVLYGVARFSVAERGPGEGPFLVYTTSGIIGTKGTTYAVGVAATGETRVGVEDGEVEVAGTAKLDEPVTLAAGKAATLSVKGEIADPEEFTEDDWGDWIDELEAEADPEKVVEVHTEELEAEEAATEEAYAELEELTNATAELEANDEKLEEENDAEAYEAGAEEGAATIEATFLASLRLQQLTYAMLGHAYVANEVYLRHPDELEAVFAPARPRVYGAILYHKKYHAAVYGHVRPLRDVYYVHHPRGREHAKMVKHAVPKFYGKVKLRPLPPGLARKHVRMAVYRPPEVKRFKKGKRVWVAAPAPKWAAKAEAKPRKYRGRGWYVRPKSRRGRVFAGVETTRKRPRYFGVTKPKALGSVEVRLGIGPRGGKVGVGVGPRGGKVGVGVGPRGGKAGVRVGPKGGKVGVGVGPRGGVRVHAGKGGKVKDVRVGPHGGVGVRVKKGDVTKGVRVGPRGGVKAGVKVKGGGSVKVRRPAPKKRKHR